jgi:hypothetical protein
MFRPRHLGNRMAKIGLAHVSNELASWDMTVSGKK